MAKVNWRQAGAEVGLLALGATIAIGADAWVDARRDRDAEQVYLESLREDIEDSLEMAAVYVADNRSSIEATNDLLSALVAPSGNVSPDSLHGLIERAFWIHTWDPVQGTYQDMISSGSLSLLESVGLRAELARTDELHDNVKRFDDMGWQHWTDFELPYLQARADLGQIYQDYTSNAEERGVMLEPIRFPAAEFTLLSSDLRSLEFRNIVVARSVMHQDALANAMIAIGSFESLLEIIEEELRRIS